MKKGSGKRKGSQFEREIANKLSLYLTSCKEDLACWRSASSGAVSTKGFKTKKSSLGLKSQSGDIIQTIPKGHYNKLDNFFDTYMVETKSLKSLDISPNYSKAFQKIMIQLLREKEQSSKNIFFVLKRNQRETLIITDTFFGIDNIGETIPSVGSFVYEEKWFNIYYFDSLIKKEIV